MNRPAMDRGCAFCRIAARELPAELLHVSDRIVAFRDADPKAPSHVLIIPREHVVSLSDIGDRHAGMLVELMTVARHLARAEGIDKSGWRIVANSGPDAGQSVFHLHFHLLGGRPMSWPPG